MDTTLILFCLVAYFLLLYVISMFTSKGADNATFFTGNRASPWYLVAFGMIGASLSGVTFISVPGQVGSDQFSYMQMVLGYLPGYFLIAFVLMPLYYRLNLTTIYTYLDTRFGPRSYQTGAWFFLVSRLLGSALRMYLTAATLQIILFDHLGVPFFMTVIGSIALILLYTYRAGIKTVVWTDTLQTTFMLLAVVGTIYYIADSMSWNFSDTLDNISNSPYSQIFFFDDSLSAKNFFKQFLSGALIALVMTGLDQDMMQKNLTCRNIREAQINMVSFSVVLVFVNLLFLALGAMLYMFAGSKGMAIGKPDELYGLVVQSGALPAIVGVFFVLGLVAAAYSSADSALTALTTSFCIDILRIERQPEEKRERIRKITHLGFSILTIIIILVAREFHNDSLLKIIFRVASYTYGPLLGLFAFGLFSKRPVNDKLVPFMAMASPVLCLFIERYSNVWLSYQFGYEILLVNALLMILGLRFIK